MSLLKTAFTSAAFLGAGLFTMTPSDADAQIRVQIGGTNWGYGNGYRSSGYRYDNYGYRSSRYDGNSSHRHYSGYRGYDRHDHGYNNYGYRDRGHYDYHPTTVVPHGNHYDVIPGHYHYHQGGHHH